jgi:hypothetical protein
METLFRYGQNSPQHAGQGMSPSLDASNTGHISSQEITPNFDQHVRDLSSEAPSEANRNGLNAQRNRANSGSPPPNSSLSTKSYHKDHTLESDNLLDKTLWEEDSGYLVYSNALLTPVEVSFRSCGHLF